MDFAKVLMEQMVGYALILARVGTLMVAAPVLGHARVPAQVKAGFSLVVALLLMFSLQGLPAPRAAGILELMGLLLGEIFVGLVIAYTAFLFFTAIQIAGQMVDIQVGFGLVNVLDPAHNVQISVLGQFYYLTALLFFLTLDGHHFLLKALGDSFQLVPPGRLFWIDMAPLAGPKLAEFFTKLFSIALQVAGPSVAALFLTNLAMGLLSRTIPQMNVFIVGLPLNVLVGLMVTVLSLQFLGALLRAVVESMGQSIAGLLRTLGA